MQILNIFHVLVAIAMVAFILVQRGPGATAGAAFGSGASGTVFGSRGAGSFLSRSTWVMGALFCLISLVMAVIVSRELSAPETDMGVIGNAAPTEQVQEPLPTMDDASTDVPGLDPQIDLQPGAEMAPPAADVPPLDLAPVGEAPADDGSNPDEDGPGR